MNTDVVGRLTAYQMADKMKRRIVWACLFALACLYPCVSRAADDFTVCKGTFALCTTAKCAPFPGQEGIVSCECDVRTGYSAGHQSCRDAEATNPGQLMSRYYPVKYHVICSNSRPWASCLDKPCTVEKGNPSRASCACSLMKDQGDYVIVTETYADSTCTTGIISSATVKDSAQITDFLKTQGNLKPFPIKIVNPKQ